MTSIGDPLVGRLLDGRYQITSRLARGGMATVYQAVDTRLTRVVAVKVMHVGLGDDHEFARKFDREARAAAKLSHPHVVSVFDQGQDMMDGHTVRPYIVMEYIEGQTLRDVINANTPMPPVAALDTLEPVLAALAAAHDAGLVHRDVKPENVLIGERGQIKVADFGLAKAISSQTSTATQGLLIGTVSYLPPELVVSGKSDARSDVYSAGIVLFELLTGRKPHTGETPIQVAYAHVHRDVPAPSSYPTAAAIPPYLDALVARATSRRPELRPHDARVMLTQLRRVRAALREGLRDDPELTQDLSGVLAQSSPDQDTTIHGDRSDYEPTQLVSTPTPEPIRPSAPRSPVVVRTTASAGTTAYDAPPPTPVPAVRAPPPLAPSRVGPDRVTAARERQARRRRRGWLALLLVLLLTAAAALAGWYLLDGRFTSAPALATLSQDDAVQAAERAGLSIDFTDAYSDSIDRGLVVSTNPGPGAKVRKGGRLDAELSLGPERFAMPAVRGLSEAEARAALQTASLVTGKVNRRWSSRVAVGVVSDASSPAGASLKRNTAVGLTVSKGPEPIKIRDFTGKDASDAVAALKKAGFTVTEKSAHSDSVSTGRVISQDPSTGTGVKGDTVTLSRSLGPVLVTVPNVRQMGTKAAQQVMKDAGFKTKVRPVAVNYLGVGFVAYSNPRARTQAPRGSTITLYVV